MRNPLAHPVSVVPLLLLLSVGVHPTPPGVEGPDAPGATAAVSFGAHVGQEGGPCWLSCYSPCFLWGWHWASKVGDRSRWDEGDHFFCMLKPCGDPPAGKHAPCTPAQSLAELDEAVANARADEIAEILAANQAIVLHSERRAIQVWSTCQEGELGAHMPLRSGLFNAVVLALDQDAPE